MVKTNPPTPPSFFSASLPPAMLEEILQRIDENLYSRPLLTNQSKSGEEYNPQFDRLSLPPTPPNFFERITEIRNAQAPYYVISGNFISRFIKRMHNLVLKLFGRKQAYFNTLTMNVLEAMAAYLSALQEHNKSQSVLANALARQMTLQMEQFSAMQIDYQRLVAQIEQLTAKQDENQNPRDQAEQLTSQQNDTQQQVDRTEEEIKGLSDGL